jgi:hypothetical protein
MAIEGILSFRCLFQRIISIKGDGFPLFNYNVVIFQTDRLDQTDQNVRQLLGVNPGACSGCYPANPHSIVLGWGKIILAAL